MRNFYTLTFLSVFFFNSNIVNAATSTISAPLEFSLTNKLDTAEITKTKSIEQHGITWTFSEPVQYGQFVNGDYWVIDPGNGIKIINISPGYSTHPETGRAMNGSMVDPASSDQGYDGFNSYNPALNVSIGITPEKPLVLTGKVSLVSTKSNLDAGVSNKPYVNAASVLTCLSSPPPEGSFRPGISSKTKTLHNFKDVDIAKLKSLACPPVITKPSISTYAGHLQMVWLTHSGSWTGVYMRPTASGLDKYYFPGTFSTAALMLHLDYSTEEKKPLLINFLQLGIDIYSFIENGGKGWPPDGGHSNGRKWPILFAGIMLDYPPMKNIGQISGDYLYSGGHGSANPPSDYIHFAEDGQTFYVAQSDVDITNGTTWKADSRNGTPYPYAVSMIQMPEWGIRYSTHPTLSNSAWTAIYRTIGSGPPAWAGTAMAAYIMGAKAFWNHNAHFDYLDRYMAITAGLPDPFGFKVEAEVAGGSPGDLVGAMWNTYRKNY